MYRLLDVQTKHLFKIATLDQRRKVAIVLAYSSPEIERFETNLGLDFEIWILDRASINSNTDWLAS